MRDPNRASPLCRNKKPFISHSPVLNLAPLELLPLISIEEVRIEDIPGDFLCFVDDLDPGDGGSDQRAVETDSDHPLAEC